MRDTPNASTEAMRRAFAQVAKEHRASPSSDLATLVDAAAVRHGLSQTQRLWMRWSFDPASVALQTKEPRK